jgi:hypothetical protein
MMPKRTLLPVALGVLALSGCATTSDTRTPTPASSYTGPPGWSYLDTNARGDEDFIDYSTIRRDGDLVTLWQKTNYKRPTQFGDRSIRVQHQYDCRNEKSRILVITGFTGADLTGDITGSETTPTAWKPVQTGNPLAAKLRSACR